MTALRLINDDTDETLAVGDFAEFRDGVLTLWRHDADPDEMSHEVAVASDKAVELIERDGRPHYAVHPPRALTLMTERPTLPDRVTARPFDGFEVHLVAEYVDPDGPTTYFETVDTLTDYASARGEAIRFLFTTYGHRTWPDPMPPAEVSDGYGLTAIADFERHVDALDLAQALAAGRAPVEDCAPVTEVKL